MPREFQDQIRIAVNRYIFKNCYAPSTAELAKILNTDEDNIKRGLKLLAENHAIVLHPGSFNIWVAHPFALFPTLFWVESGSKKWWGNCTWCSLGIAALVNTDTRIYTKLAGEEEAFQIDIFNGKVIQENMLVHFSVPAKKLWDNVIYSCSTMLTFRDERQIDNWCALHNIQRGEVLTLGKVWELSKLWYGNYLEDNWTRKSPEYAESIFKKAGLEGEFWKLT